MKYFLLILSISFATFCQSQNENSSVALLKEMVESLAHDSMQGRSAGSVYEHKAFQYIKTQFHTLNHKKLKENSFNFRLDTAQVTSTNGFFFLNKHKKETIIISAHYDHIGLGGELSMSRKNDQIHNGADDNASGVALLLALSQKLIAKKNLDYNILFVFYGAHEVGLYGSTAFQKYAAYHQNQFKTVALVINFDMVGRLDDSLKKVKCMRSPNAVPFFTASKPELYNIEIVFTDEQKLYLLDTKAFVENNIPCINFTTGIHNDYHTTTDDSQYINYKAMQRINQYLYTLITGF